MPNVAGDSYSRAITYLYTGHICQFASAFREKVKEDEAARESKSDKVKDEFDKVKDDLLLWIKEAPVLKFRNLNLVIENAGGKTGTTNDARDTWFVGYAENIIASSWVGKDDGSTLGDEQFGSSNALPIWLDFMNNSIDLLDETTFGIPEDITLVRIDKDTGKVASTFDNAIFEYFLDDDLKDILN